MSRQDEGWMRLAIEEAMRPKTSVLPNPRVGAAIVHQGRLVSTGSHRGPGKLHAEIDAIKKAERKGFRQFKHASLYVTLEPCCHSNKKTPACLPHVIEKNFKKIIVAQVDPNPQVNGRSIRELKKQTDVKLGVLREEAEAINQAFIKNQSTGLPYVILKAAQSFDGKWACPNGESQWITGKKSQALVHQWRRSSQVLAVGKGTILKDDPQLNVRLGSKKEPKRVLIFGDLPDREWRVFKANGRERVVVLKHFDDLAEQLQFLYAEEGICEIFLEGGPRLASSFLEAGLVDFGLLFYGKGFIGGSGRYSVGPSWGLKSPQESVIFQPRSVQILDLDVCVEGYFHVYGTHTTSRKTARSKADRKI